MSAYIENSGHYVRQTSRTPGSLSEVEAQKGDDSLVLVYLRPRDLVQMQLEIVDPQRDPMELS